MRLSTEFYARVRKDPVLHTLFPGKTLKCAIEEFAAFLIQFLGGDDGQTQRRWWLSLRESHARFRISEAERSAWLKHMGETLAAIPCDEATRAALHQFFVRTSAYLIGKEAADSEHSELAGCWSQQLTLDEAVAAIVAGRDLEAMDAAGAFVSRPSVLVGLLGRMLQSGRADLIGFVVTLNPPRSISGIPSICRTDAAAFCVRCWLHRCRRIVIAARRRSERARRRRPHSPVLRGKRVRVRGRPGSGTCAGASGRGCERIWRRHAGDRASHGRTPGSCRDCSCAS
jgi:truncated hemoglobin YjbI